MSDRGGEAGPNGVTEKVLATAVESVFWIRLLLSPLVAGFVLGGLAFLMVRGTWGGVAWALCGIAGLAGGVALAEHGRRTQGTVDFSARASATADLEGPPEESSYQ